MSRPTSVASKQDPDRDDSLQKDSTNVVDDMSAWPTSGDSDVEQATTVHQTSSTAVRTSRTGHTDGKHGTGARALVRNLTGRSGASAAAPAATSTNINTTTGAAADSNGDNSDIALTDHLDPPPDGGARAWTQAFCVHLTVFSTFGYLTSFGVFQTYYENSLGVSPSTISWIGSTQIFLLFFIGTFSGRALDAGLFRPVYVAGAVFQLLGIFATSAARNFWQLFLAQALCSGIANGLQFCPAMSLLTTYFTTKRAWAVGIGQLGSCTGGVVFPVVVQQLVGRIGFPWTVRVIGFIMLATNIVTIALYRPRLPPRRTGPIVEWEAFKEAPYALYCAALFFTFWGLYFTFFYVGSYGRTVLNISYAQSINVLLTVVCAGFVFRLVPNYFADTLGTLNSLIPFVFLCGIMMFAWIGVHSVASLFVFAAIYGSGSAGIQSLFPAVFHPLSRHPDLKKSGVRMGMTFSLISFAVLTGAPLGGALIQHRQGDYLYAQIWGGISFFVGGLLLIAARFAKVGWDWTARI